MVYVGNGMIVHCDGGHGKDDPQPGGEAKGGLSYETIEHYAQRGGDYEHVAENGCYIRIYRIRAEAAAGLAEGRAGPSDGNGFISGAIQSVIDGITGFFGELTNENEVFPEGTAL